MQNLKDTIITFKNNIVRVLGTIWDNLPLKPWQKWIGAIVVSAGPILTVVGTITKVVGGIVGVVSKVSSAVSALITGFKAQRLEVQPFPACLVRLVAPLVLLVALFG